MLLHVFPPSSAATSRPRGLGAGKRDPPGSYRVDYRNSYLDRGAADAGQIAARQATVAVLELLGPLPTRPVAQRSQAARGVVVGPRAVAKRVAPPGDVLQSFPYLSFVPRRIALVILERSHEPVHERAERLVHRQLQVAFPGLERFFRFLYRLVLPSCRDRQIGALQRILKKAERGDRSPQLLQKSAGHKCVGQRSGRCARSTRYPVSSLPLMASARRCSTTACDGHHRGNHHHSHTTEIGPQRPHQA